MSIAYQSWEIGSGPTVGYKVQGHQAGGDGLNFRKIIYRPQPQPQPQPQQQQIPETSSTKPPAKFLQQQQQNNLLNGSSDSSPSSSSSAWPSSSSSSSSSSKLRVSSKADDSRRFGAESISNNSSAGSSLAQQQQIHEQQQETSSSSIVTSSISGDNTSDDDDKEVESSFKGPLEQMDSLMTTLPVRRGLSKFYVGKSRSFTSLADVKSMSVKDLAKPDNPYVKKRKLPVSHRPPRVATGIISKKPISSSNGATTLTLAVAMSTKEGVVEGGESSDCRGMNRSCRSFSLTDLQKA